MPTVGGAASGSSRAGWGKAGGIAGSEGGLGGLGNLKGMSELNAEKGEPKTLGGCSSKVHGFMGTANVPDNKGGGGSGDTKKTARLTLGRPGGAFGGVRRGRGRGRGMRR